MIALFLSLITLYSTDQIIVQQSTSSSMHVKVAFSDYSKIEQKPVARFILAENKPTATYQITKTDSTVPVSEYIRPNDHTSPVEIGNPVIMNNVRLYPILVRPNYFNENSNVYCEEYEIEVQYAVNSKQLELSGALRNALKGLILNLPENGQYAPAGYLIITPDGLINDVLPLAYWKERKGWTVEVRTLSQTGSTANEIRNYIANAYNTWTPRPEYVLLIGDVNYIPAASSSPSLTDHPYTMISSGDFFSDLLIGRLPAASASELNTMVAKIIGYETDPYMTSTTWFKRALMVGANQPGFMTTPIPTKRWTRDRLLEYGFNTVDTVFHPMPSSSISNSIDQGVIFVNYRSGEGDPNGWPWPDFRNDDINALNNGRMLPIVTSITCFTGHFGYGTCFGEAWLRAGSAGNQRGAVGFFGSSSPSTHSRWNNCLDYGIYWAFAREDIAELGPGLYRGKMEVYTNFPGDTTVSSGSGFYFHSYNLLGDPSMSVWTDIPDSFLVTHSASMSVGASSFSVQVSNSSSQPVENAMVSLYKANEVKEISFTDAGGNADFNFTTSTQDTLFVTVTEHNYKPYRGHCLVNNSSVYVGYYDHTINDPSGNNNGQVNPGETIELGVTLKNYGNSTAATSVSARLTTDDPLVTVTDSLKSYGSISPGATAATSSFVFNVSTGAQNGHILKFDLEITSNQGNWSGSVWIDVLAPEFLYQWDQVIDGGNGVLEPGETADYIISIQNIGQLNGSNISAVLRSINPGVVVTDSIGSFGNIALGDSATNNSNRFSLSAVSSISPGYALDMVAILSGDNNFTDTVEFSMTLGVVNQSKPFGPDDYGYFAYDDTDVGYLEKPDYNWVEIDPAHGGLGDTLSLLNDETKTMAMPFSFKFYGDWYDQVSISSNGYIAMGSTWVADMYNWQIPAAGGPPLLIAPFWDDLDPNATDSSGNVCYWYDATNHRFVIEYSRVQHLHDPTNPTPAELQTFEVMLFDPQYYPTQTGDGEILFQYYDITNDDVWHNYATVGIEDHDHTTGLEYTFANHYPDAAAPLANNRAIKFTTDPPDTFFGIREFKNSAAANSWLEISPNPFRQRLEIRCMIRDPGSTIQDVALGIYDATGRLVRYFNPESSIMNQGSCFWWDGKDNTGKKVAEGVYFVRLQAANVAIARKVILVD